jgi:riboflavin kinase/FMN adenylyltransferase/tRNA pseudouridine(55) synthase
MTPQPSLHGYLVIDKPGGWTSFDVVARARRLLGEKRIGHAGTLDPAATGVLPLAVGLATKTLEFLERASKTYLAEVTFGVETDSHDGDGRVTAVTDAGGLSEDVVEAVLARFRGPGEQIPPMHAAIKIGGRKLYELARQGEEIERAPRPIVIHRLELLAWNAPTATLQVDCSKGTYIRSLARDLGAATGTGAFLSNLVRLRSGPFHLCQALTIAELAEAALPWSWPWIAIHPDVPVEHWPALILDEPDARRWRQGAMMPATGAAGPIRAYDTAGDWLGTGHADDTGTGWQPRKVTPAPLLHPLSEATPTPPPSPPHDRIVTIGTFDGVHRGHQRLLDQAVQRGREMGLPVTGVTFEPVPAAVLRPETFAGRISSPEDKLRWLKDAGLDEIVVVPFTPELSRWSPHEFMTWLKEQTALRELWVGEEFALGKDRTGTVARLTEIGAELGFRVVAVPRLTNGDEVVSSSRIRSAVMDGDVAKARRLLGRPFRVSGEVVHGQHLGRAIGFPTANVAPPPGLAPVADGIYAAWGWLPGDTAPRPAVAYIGSRPTVDGGERMIETHLLDFDGDLYGQTLATDFLERLRPDERFASLDALIAQMQLDKARAREVLETESVIR